MKVIKIFAILTAILFSSCGESKPNVKRVYKYQVGDVVSMKPDGQRAIIMKQWTFVDNYDYMVKYYIADEERYSEDLIKEFEIFNKVQ
jgi:hypothetical protein